MVPHQPRLKALRRLLRCNVGVAMSSLMPTSTSELGPSTSEVFMVQSTVRTGALSGGPAVMTAQPAAVTMTVMARDPVVGWLLAGDVSVQFRTTRDLLHQDGSHLQNRIADEGDGATILAARHPDGHWETVLLPQVDEHSLHAAQIAGSGTGSTHPDCRESVSIVLRDHRNDDGGLHPNRSSPSDACVNGMALNYASYFGAGEDELGSMVDFLLGGLLPDGGFNCRSRREEVQHSSLHTTLSVVEESRATTGPATRTERTNCWQRRSQRRVPSAPSTVPQRAHRPRDPPGVHPAASPHALVLRHPAVPGLDGRCGHLR